MFIPLLISALAISLGFPRFMAVVTSVGNVPVADVGGGRAIDRASPWAWATPDALDSIATSALALAPSLVAAATSLVASATSSVAAAPMRAACNFVSLSFAASS